MTYEDGHIKSKLLSPEEHGWTFSLLCIGHDTMSVPQYHVTELYLKTTCK